VSPGPRRIAEPRRAAVQADAAGMPRVVDGRTVDAVRESWLVEDRWWTGRPLRRRYWEVVTVCGRNVVVFHDLVEPERGWYRQC
jgi:CO dehydrogenase/acetyl-CoA synthase delta subunit